MNPALASPPVNGAARIVAARAVAPPSPAPEWRSSDVRTVTASLFLPLAVAASFAAFSEPCRHWFLLPVLACGILTALDLVDWLRGRMDLFDPVGIIGFLGFHTFFLAPLLHVAVDSWMPYIEPPPDWREWLGKMGALNAAGLGVYAVLIRAKSAAGKSAPPREWRVRNGGLILVIALAITAGIQAWVYARFGGIGGFVEVFERESDTGKSSFTGWGWLFIVCESFPRLAFMGFTLYLWRRGRRPSWALLGTAFLVLFGLLIVFGGLRGSRSNFVWSLFWAAAILHFCLRPLPRKAVFVGLAALLGFMVVYAAYKHGGREDFKRVLAGEESKRGTTLTRVALGDLARSDVQAFLFYQLSRVGGDFELAWGRTYLGAATLLIPQSLWPDRPPTKVQEGTWILWGKDAIVYKASNLYGLSGETMLNFGPALVPAAFALFAVFIRWVRSFVYRLHPRDGRIFLLPVFIGLCIIGLMCDSDNWVFFLFQYGTSVAMVLVFTCRRVPLPLLNPRVS